MQQHLIDTFLFNDDMNTRMLEKIKEIPEKDGCIKYFSHLINSQIKWLARIQQDENAPGLSWWDPIYPLDQLKERWEESLQTWIDFLKSKLEDEIFQLVDFTGYDGARWRARLADIALQLNYHSIHHRAQMQTMIRQQGIEPEFIDYIGTRYERVS